MLLTRIYRGAGRVSLLAQHKLSQYHLNVPVSLWRPTRVLLLNALVIRTVLMPVPLAAPATAVAAGPDDAEPLSRLVRVSVTAQQALNLTRTDQTEALTITASQLQPITVGQSLADARVVAEAAAQAAAAEAARVAEETRKAEEAKAALAARQAALQAQTKAQAIVPVPVAGDQDIQSIIRNAAAMYGTDATLMLRIAKCESGFNPSAKNRSSAASGLFQFMPTTYANSPSARAGRSIWDAQANAEAAAYKIANGGLRAWNASRSCWNR